MTTDMTTDIVTVMEQKFTSSNHVPVTMSRITLEDWQRLKELVFDLKDDVDSSVDTIDKLKAENLALREYIKDLYRDHYEVTDNE